MASPLQRISRPPGEPQGRVSFARWDHGMPGICWMAQQAAAAAAAQVQPCCQVIKAKQMASEGLALVSFMTATSVMWLMHLTVKGDPALETKAGRGIPQMATFPWHDLGPVSA